MIVAQNWSGVVPLDESEAGNEAPHIPSTLVLNFLSSCSHQVLNSELASFTDSRQRILSCEEEYTTPELVKCDDNVEHNPCIKHMTIA